jgi:hypothetical protein
MQNDFSITVPYKGKDREFNVNVMVTGYTYRFFVTVDETEVIFEKDEEGNYRALKAQPFEGSQSRKEVDLELLRLIQQTIEKAFE